MSANKIAKWLQAYGMYVFAEFTHYYNSYLFKKKKGLEGIPK